MQNLELDSSFMKSYAAKKEIKEAAGNAIFESSHFDYSLHRVCVFSYDFKSS